jgi:RNA polymerase sigma-70 factor (ECF subfamily)
VFWTEVFSAQRNALHGFFLRRVVHPWDAQDLVQEVYLRLLRADREAVINPEAYLFTVAANLAKEHAVMRRRAPVSTDGLEDVIERLAVPSEAEDSIDRELRRQRLGELIARLTPKCRAVLVMQYRDELGYREIGERLGISTHMVKKYIVKALAFFRHGLARYD